MASSSTRGGQFDFEGEGVGRFLKQIREALKKKKKKRKKKGKKEKKGKKFMLDKLYIMHRFVTGKNVCVGGGGGWGGGNSCSDQVSQPPTQPPPPKKNTPSLPARPSKAKWSTSKTHLKVL